MARCRIITFALAALVLISTVNNADASGKGKPKNPGASCTPANVLTIIKKNVAVAPYAIPDKINGFPMTRHHIIPKNKLIGFFNKVVVDDCTSPGELKLLAPSLKRLALYGKTHNFNPGRQLPTDEVTQLHYDLGHVPNQQEMNARSYEIAAYTADKLANGQIAGSNPPVEDTADARGMRLLKHLYVWNPFNIFIGPTNRDDDAEDNFENNAVYLIGKHDFDILNDINNLMDEYITKSDVGKLDAIGRKLSDIVKDNNINPSHAYGYDASKWVEDKGKYSIKKPHGAKGDNRGGA